MPTVHIETDELVKAALQLPPIELEKFVTKLFVLKAKEHTPSLSQRESELLLRVNQTLSPPQRKRLNLLIKKRQAHTITSAELQELKQIAKEARAAVNDDRLERGGRAQGVGNHPLELGASVIGCRGSPFNVLGCNVEASALAPFAHLAQLIRDG